MTGAPAWRVCVANGTAGSHSVAPSLAVPQPAPLPTLLPPRSQGKIAGAQADFRQVLALEPGNRQAREELTRIRALGGAGSDEGGDLGSSLQAEFFAAGNLSSAL